MRKKVIFGTVAALFLGAGIFTSVNLTEKHQMSNLTLANIEAMTIDKDIQQPDVNDCISDKNYSCEALHPTDPAKDKLRPEARW